MMTLTSKLSARFLKRPVTVAACAAFALAAAAVPGAALLALGAPAAAQSQAGDLDRAVAALRGISTMRADFTQTDRSGNASRGVLTLKRGGKIRFDYGKDSDLLMVSNGKSLYLVDYEVDQVERWPIKNTPLGALLDPDQDVKRFGTLIETGSPDVVNVLVEDPKKPEYGAISLIFFADPSAPGGLQLVNWVAKDAQNYRTTVRLSNHRYGLSVADSTFTFRDPRRSSRRPK
ncbi:MAG: outer membrane lipoprotein carrier protein LolA [Pseudomonadota bacterium]